MSLFNDRPFSPTFRDLAPSPQTQPPAVMRAVMARPILFAEMALPHTKAWELTGNHNYAPRNGPLQRIQAPPKLLPSVIKR